MMYMMVFFLGLLMGVSIAGILFQFFAYGD